MIRKIAITGPESTGKSLLAEQLAFRYKTIWVPEYAREYLKDLDRQYNETDVVNIAKGQIRNEQSKLKLATQFIFCDTELIVTKIWSEVKYSRCDPWILRNIEHHKYDLFLLCNIDLPWVDDPLREHPDRRKYLFDLYYNELITRKFPFYVISGEGDARLANAVTFIDSHFHLIY